MRWSLFLTLFVFLGVVGCTAYAGTLTYISDLIATSAPATSTAHTVQFTVQNAVPPSGHIIITPESGAFTIPATLDYEDIDLAVSSGGPYADRDLAATADAINDGVSIAAGTSGSIAITLNSAVGIAAGEKVQLRLGTIATYGAAGTDSIVNPGPVTSYSVDVETRDSGNTLIDFGRTMIAVVEPVTLSATGEVVYPTRFNGLPSGLIAANNTSIEISLETNIPSTCRYATTTGVLYDDMTGTFSPSLGLLFYTDTTGYQNDTTYNYYVRCLSQGGAANIDDYVISFTLKPTPISNTSEESDGFVTSGPTGNLGNGGPGDFPNGSQVLYLSSVELSGWTVPSSQVTVLKDGVKAGTVQAKSDGSFDTTLTGIERGVYGFQLYTQDGHGLTSSLHGSTLSISQGTTNEITDIVIPPTIQLSKNSIQSGDEVVASGSAPPDAKVQITVKGQSGTATLVEPRTYTASTTKKGDWSVSLDTTKLTKGNYIVQATVTRTDKTTSGPSKSMILSVGTGGISASCGSPDMNSDDKVNLVDFSIFLLSWDTENAEADFNCDGKVNLADFSIMLFEWTG